MNATRSTAAPEPTAERPTFAPFVATCAKHGIAKTTAYELADAGLLDTFTIGRRRYVYLESLRTLPERLAAQKEAA